jgi:hypothetical protein
MSPISPIPIGTAPTTYKKILLDAEYSVNGQDPKKCNQQLDTEAEILYAAYQVALYELDLGHTSTMDYFNIVRQEVRTNGLSVNSLGPEFFTGADEYLRQQIGIMTYADKYRIGHQSAQDRETIAAVQNIMSTIISSTFTAKTSFASTSHAKIDPSIARILCEAAITQPEIDKAARLLLNLPYDFPSSKYNVWDNVISSNNGKTVTLADLEKVMNDPQKTGLKDLFFPVQETDYPDALQIYDGIPYLQKRNNPSNPSWFFSYVNLTNNTSIPEDLTSGGIQFSAKANNKVFLIGQISTRGRGIHDFTIIDAQTNQLLMTLHTYQGLEYSKEDNAYYVTGKTIDGQEGVFDVYTGALVRASANESLENQ